MGQYTKEAWNEVGERFASWGSRLSDRYKEAGSTESVEDAQRKLREAARQIGNELDRAFSALDDTLRDPDAKKDLKNAVGAIGSAVIATIDEAAAVIRRRGGSGNASQPPEPQEGERPGPA